MFKIIDGFVKKDYDTKSCKYCGVMIYRGASVCPNCRNKQKTSIWWIVIALMAIIVVFNAMDEDTEKKIDNGNVETDSITETKDKEEESEEDYKASCQEYAYKTVLRNPEDYIGKRVKITVKISSVHKASLLNDEKYYFAYSNDEYDWWTGDRYGVFDRRKEQNPKLLEDDIITVYGEISDPEYTKSLIVSSSELFCIDMKYIDFISE